MPCGFWRRVGTVAIGFLTLTVRMALKCVEIRRLKKMKAVIYARYSSDNQREESIEGQIRECAAFAEKNGITILRHYIDRAFSAKTDAQNFRT